MSPSRMRNGSLSTRWPSGWASGSALCSAARIHLAMVPARLRRPLAGLITLVDAPGRRRSTPAPGSGDLPVPDWLPQRQRGLLPDRLLARGWARRQPRLRLAAAGAVARHGDPLHPAGGPRAEPRVVPRGGGRDRCLCGREPGSGPSGRVAGPRRNPRAGRDPGANRPLSVVGERSPEATLDAVREAGRAVALGAGLSLALGLAAAFFEHRRPLPAATIRRANRAVAAGAPPSRRWSAWQVSWSSPETRRAGSATGSTSSSRRAAPKARRDRAGFSSTPGPNATTFGGSRWTTRARPRCSVRGPEASTTAI